MKIVRRIGTGGKGGDISTGKDGCPDIFELDTGDFAIIGTTKTQELVHGLPEDARLASYESIVVIPRALMVSAKSEIPQN